MIKKSKMILLGLITMVIVPQMVYAVGLTCDTQTYSISKSGTNVFNLNGGETYNLNFYNTSSNGATNVKTYCLDPGRKGPSGSTYVCDRMIDPTGQLAGVGSKQHALDVAITRAYYLLAQRYNSGSDFDRSVGEIVFRWLFFNYNLGDTEITLSYATGSRYVDYFSLNYGGTVKPYWNGLGGRNGEIAEAAKEIFYDAVGAGNRVYREIGGSATYQDLIHDGTLPSDEFEYTVTNTIDAAMGSRKIYTVQFTAAPAGATVWWNEFTVGSSSNRIRIERVENDGNGKLVIHVNEGSNPGEYDLYIDTSFYVSDVASTSLKILKSRVYGLQRMLVAVDSGRSEDAHAVIHGGNRIQITGGCVKKGGSWYICQYDSSGNEECEPDTGGVCSPTTSGRACEVVDGTYFDSNGNQTDPLTYYDECCEDLDPDSEEYKKYCPCGYPDINFIGACSEFNSDSEIINTVKDTKDNAQLKTCLFNEASTDAAGNTVKMTDTTTVVNNRYCKVSCIEEYEFKLPNAKYTTSGGYFSLSSEVSGKRTCYVNASNDGVYDGIDYKQFIKDLEEKTKVLVNAYNQWNKLNIGLQNIASRTITASSKGDVPTCSIPLVNGVCLGEVGSTCGDVGDGCSTSQYYNKEYTYTSYEVVSPTEASIRVRNAVVSVRKKTSNVSEDHWTDGEAKDGSCDGERNCSVVEGTEANLVAKIKAGDGSGSMSSLAATITRTEKEIQNIIQSYNNCTTWENQMVFNPTIEFEYDEPYQDLGGFNKTFVQKNLSTSPSNQYCTDINNQYNCTAGTSGSPINYSQQFVTCKAVDNGCSGTSKNIYNSAYMKKAVTYKATYEPQNKFSVYTPLGTIQLDRDSGLYTLLCKEDNCLPVSLNTTTGVFNFKFNFSNVGQYNDSNSTGRLMGGSNNVFDAVNLDAGYVCQYVNNCPDCDYVCVGETCEITEEPECPDCPYVCFNCIFDGNEDAFSYRTVSINNLFPNTREYGPNWDNEKGKYTKKLIENTGEEAYSDPEYEYEINANQIAKIKQFNLSAGNYLNSQMPNGDDSLICHSLTSNGVTYENIYCESAFLNTSGNVYFTEKKRNDRWTLWPDSGYFTSSTRYSVRDGIGPSWR